MDKKTIIQLAIAVGVFVLLMFGISQYSKASTNRTQQTPIPKPTPTTGGGNTLTGIASIFGSLSALLIASGLLNNIGGGSGGGTTNLPQDCQPGYHRNNDGVCVPN